MFYWAPTLGVAVCLCDYIESTVINTELKTVVFIWNKYDEIYSLSFCRLCYPFFSQMCDLLVFKFPLFRTRKRRCWMHGRCIIGFQYNPMPRHSASTFMAVSHGFEIFIVLRKHGFNWLYASLFCTVFAKCFPALSILSSSTTRCCSIFIFLHSNAW